MTTGKASKQPGAEPATSKDEATELAYFRRIEDRFIELRGAPLFLSPSDYQVAKVWWQAGIPVDLVERSLEEVFERRRERGTARRSVSSLSYCASAVEQAWAEVRELTAAGHRRSDPAPKLESAERLHNLAAALPTELTDRQRFADAVQALTGSPEHVETELERLDAELLQHVESHLDDAARARLTETLESTLHRLGARLDRAELERARERLRRQLLRQQLHLPVLSLFAPEAGA